jgi:hypothetical protein
MRARSRQKKGRTTRIYRPVVFLTMGVGVLGLLALIREGIRMILDREKPASSEAEEALSEVLIYLQEHLGPEMTAYLSGAESPSVVQQWSKGTAQPQATHEVRLRPAYRAARYVVDAYGDETARQWFFGMNPSLDDTAPAYVLRHGPSEQREIVVPAAMEFVETAR